MTKGIENKIRAMVFKFKKPTIAKISKEKLEAIVGEDREKAQCESCWKYVFRNAKPGQSQIRLCCLGLDTEARQTCTEWEQTRDHGLIAEAILDESKKRISLHDYLESCKKG